MKKVMISRHNDKALLREARVFDITGSKLDTHLAFYQWWHVLDGKIRSTTRKLASYAVYFSRLELREVSDEPTDDGFVTFYCDEAGKLKAKAQGASHVAIANGDVIVFKVTEGELRITFGLKYSGDTARVLFATARRDMLDGGIWSDALRRHLLRKPAAVEAQAPITPIDEFVTIARSIDAAIDAAEDDAEDGGV